MGGGLGMCWSRIPLLNSVYLVLDNVRTVYQIVFLSLIAQVLTAIGHGFYIDTFSYLF